MVRRVDTETPARERVPEQAPVRAVVAVRICLDPRVACRGERRVARLQRERVEEEVEEDGVPAGRAEERALVPRQFEGRVEKAAHVGSVCAVAEKPCTPTRAA